MKNLISFLENRPLPIIKGQFHSSLSLQILWTLYYQSAEASTEGAKRFKKWVQDCFGIDLVEIRPGALSVIEDTVKWKISIVTDGKPIKVIIPLKELKINLGGPDPSYANTIVYASEGIALSLTFFASPLIDSCYGDFQLTHKSQSEVTLASLT